MSQFFLFGYERHSNTHSKHLKWSCEPKLVPLHVTGQNVISLLIYISTTVAHFHPIDKRQNQFQSQVRHYGKLFLFRQLDGTYSIGLNYQNSLKRLLDLLSELKNLSTDDLKSFQPRCSMDEVLSEERGSVARCHTASTELCACTAILFSLRPVLTCTLFLNFLLSECDILLDAEGY